jgi:glycosyltransferase involved in cell wall biosynthesis
VCVRIALDTTYSVGPELTGIGVYSSKLLNGLPSAHPQDDFLFCYRPKQYRQARPPKLGNVRLRILQRPLPIPGLDLFHGLNQRADRRHARRVVSTFHDLFVMTSQYSTPEFRKRFSDQARKAVHNSDLIIAVSRFTAGQIESLLGVDQSRIRVVHHGVDLPRPPNHSQRQKLILFVGALQTRKNVVRLIEAFEQVPSDWRLVLAGPLHGYGAEEIMHRVQRSFAFPRIHVTGYLSVTELASLYSRARIFAFPSLDEGFGMPVLEAMAYGIPVVTSNRSALPEVAGDAAILVDPTNTDEVGQALRTLISDAAKWAELSNKGRERASLFSWEKAVESTYATYCELLK